MIILVVTYSWDLLGDSWLKKIAPDINRLLTFEYIFDARYVDAFEEEDPVDLEALSNELHSLESDIADTDKTILDFCSELNIKAPF